jgi:hypothetical protein
MKQTQVKNKSFFSFFVVEKTQRQEIDFTEINDADLMKLIRVSGAEGSPATDEFIDELIRRAGAGMIIPEFEHQIKPIENLPVWLKIWPLCLLWKQRPR